MIQDLHPCPVVENGKPCVFAGKNGTCTHKGGSCETIVGACAGCEYMDTNNRGMRFCTIFQEPSRQWSNGSLCRFGTPRPARPGNGLEKNRPRRARGTPRNREPRATA